MHRVTGGWDACSIGTYGDEGLHWMGAELKTSKRNPTVQESALYYPLAPSSFLLEFCNVTPYGTSKIRYLTLMPHARSWRNLHRLTLNHFRLVLQCIGYHFIFLGRALSAPRFYLC